MRTLIVDAECAARRRLVRLLEPMEKVEIIGEATNGVEALSTIQTLRPDLVFLDIQMPELDGFGVLRSLPPDFQRPLVIFATDVDQHALAAFEANAVGYLLKPIEPERLRVAVDRARRLHDPTRLGTEAHTPATISAETPLRRVVCRKQTKLLLLDPQEILWFYVDEGVVRAKTQTDTFWVNYQIQQLESGLDPSLFFRARREVLVNLNQVRGIKPCDRSTFLLTMADEGGSEVIVSERHAKELRRRLPGL